MALRGGEEMEQAESVRERERERERERFTCGLLLLPLLSLVVVRVLQSSALHACECVEQCSHATHE